LDDQNHFEEVSVVESSTEETTVVTRERKQHRVESLDDGDSNESDAEELTVATHKEKKQHDSWDLVESIRDAAELVDEIQKLRQTDRNIKALMYKQKKAKKDRAMTKKLIETKSRIDAKRLLRKDDHHALIYSKGEKPPPSYNTNLDVYKKRWAELEGRPDVWEPTEFTEEDEKILARLLNSAKGSRRPKLK
jgi:hypothetical protein